MNNSQKFVYSAVVQEVIDADTFMLTVDLGFHIQKNLIENPVRLAGVDAPEIETDPGQKAYSFVNGKIGGREVTIKTIKTDHYGRWLVRLWCDTLINELTTELLNEGHYKVDDHYAVDQSFMPDEFLNINEASETELTWLDGIGSYTAQNIVAARLREPFESVSDLTRVNGIGDETLADIRRVLSVS